MKRLRVVDFFCGAGGFSEGFRQEGFWIIKGIDNWSPAIATHNLNHGLSDIPTSVLDYENIDKINELPDSEIIVGSPPCVSFSLSNKGGNGDKTLGIRLIEAYLRVVAVKKHQPNSVLKAWLMENVPNSRNFVKETYTFADLNLTDWAHKYKLDPSSVALRVRENGSVLKASDYGAAQARNRFVCGELVEKGTFPMPKQSERKITLQDVRNALPAPIGKDGRELIVDPNYPALSLKKNDITDHYYDTGVYEIEWQRARAAKQNHPYMGRMSFPENETKPSRTIMATRSASTREAIIYKSELQRKGDGEYRLPTIREAASVMGFPLTYIFTGNEATKWRQVGNAVCPQLASSLAREIKEELGLRDSRGVNFVKPSNVESVVFLDNYEVKLFDRPPKRNPKSMFRNHPIKAGNMTVALTNRNPHGEGNGWAVVAFMGTGRGYHSVEVSQAHRTAAHKLLVDITPEFIEKIKNDKAIIYTSEDKLDFLNSDYHYKDISGEHPLSLVNRIGDYIAQSLSVVNDDIVDTSNSILSSMKNNLPLSQIMAVYALGTIIHDE